MGSLVPMVFNKNKMQQFDKYLISFYINSNRLLYQKYFLEPMIEKNIINIYLYINAYCLP